MVEAKAVETARKAARQALEATYEGVCSIMEYVDVIDARTKLSNRRAMVVTENQPCKLSFEKLEAAAQSETASAAFQGVKLFLAPEIRVASGSRVAVTQDGVTGEYAASGVPAVYATHQEIMLERSGKWA